MALQARNTTWLARIQGEDDGQAPDFQHAIELVDQPQDPKLSVIPQTNKTPLVVLRQVRAPSRSIWFAF